jgi:hypothetical protein
MGYAQKDTRIFPLLFNKNRVRSCLNNRFAVECVTGDIFMPRMRTMNHTTIVSAVNTFAENNGSIRSLWKTEWMMRRPKKTSNTKCLTKI